MDVVKTFNTELSSLYEAKLPISESITQITKSAIKGIKFYKYVVQCVENFIQKCRPEYKVLGLYVVHSIVKQSRHQFGADKDVFGPRFVKNITTTFQHLFKCSEKDRPKIICILNLWRKNNVFPIDVIQPLLDMGHPNTSSEFIEESRHKSSVIKNDVLQSDEESVQDKNYAKMSTKNLEKFIKIKMSNALKEEGASRSSMFKNQEKVEIIPKKRVKFNKNDYGDKDDEEVKNEDNHLSAQRNALALSLPSLPNLKSGCEQELLLLVKEADRECQRKHSKMNEELKRVRSICRDQKNLIDKLEIFLHLQSSQNMELTTEKVALHLKLTKMERTFQSLQRNNSVLQKENNDLREELLRSKEQNQLLRSNYQNVLDSASSKNKEEIDTVDEKEYEKFQMIQKFSTEDKEFCDDFISEIRQELDNVEEKFHKYVTDL